jgi:hypothetical protein
VIQLMEGDLLLEENLLTGRGRFKSDLDVYKAWQNFGGVACNYPD